jgi:hypothetical protein
MEREPLAVHPVSTKLRRGRGKGNIKVIGFSLSEGLRKVGKLS